MPTSTAIFHWLLSSQPLTETFNTVSARADGGAKITRSIVKGMDTSEDQALPSRRRRAARVNRGDQQERILLQGAEKLLRKRPLSDLTIEAVAAEAGMSRSAVYFYFANKSAIIDTLIEQVADEMFTPFARYAEDQNLADYIEEVMKQTVASWRQHRPVFQAAVELSSSDAASRARWHTILKRFSDAMAAAATAERARGRVDVEGDLYKSAASLGWMVERSCYMLFSGEHTALDEEQLLETLTFIVKRGLGVR